MSSTPKSKSSTQTRKKRRPSSPASELHGNDGEVTQLPGHLELQMLLYKKLQTTSDVDELIRMFQQTLPQESVIRDIKFIPAYQAPSTLPGATGHTYTLKLFAGDTFTGHLSIEYAEIPSSHTLQLVKEAAKTIAFPLHNALKYQDAVRKSEQDTLTGLKNRSGMDAALELASTAAERHEFALSLMMLDIDYFKQVNDIYGHLTGDKILQLLAELIRQSGRSHDQAFRYGGEEFLVLLQHTDIDGAFEVAERLRQVVELNDFGGIIEEKDLPVTLSIGVAELQTGENVQDWIRKCDRALYAAKQAGRNNVKRG